MTMFIESPWPAAMICIVLEVILAVVFMRTGRALVLVAMAVVLAVTAGMIFLEQAIVTDTEEVEDTLHGIAEDLEANDVEAVLASFAPTCPERACVRSALQGVTVHSASVSADLEVRVNKLTNPPSATTYFTGRINARENRGTTIPYENFFRKFKVRFERHGERWLIVEVQDAAPGAKTY
jgi:hypothetical protein